MLINSFYNSFISKDKHFAKKLKLLIGFVPADLQIFKMAFLHRGQIDTVAGRHYNNERLEYLGDAILGAIVAEYLYAKYPLADEGYLTKMRSKIVKRSSLNDIADRMGLDDLLMEFNQARPSKSMLGNCLEALVGALYLELGYNKTKKYIIAKILRKYLDIHQLEDYDDNYKSQLLEWGQKNGKTISYEVVGKFKIDKRDRFKIAVLVDNRRVAFADDFNKKSAEQLASERALQALGITSIPD